MRRGGIRGARITPLAAPLVALGAGLALLLVSLPGVLGGTAQRAYQGLLAELLSALPPGSILAEHYERGWFRSKAQVELVLRPQPGASPKDPLPLRIESEVEQGPLHWLDSGWPPVLARIHSRVHLPDHPLDPPPLLVTTDLGADGASRSRFRLGAGERAGASAGYRLRHGNLTGSLRFDSPTGALDLVLDLPELELASPTGTVGMVEDLRLTLGLGASPRQGKESAVGVIGSDQGRAGADPGVLGREGGTTGPGSALGQSRGPLDLRFELATSRASLGDQRYGAMRLGIAAGRLDPGVARELGIALGVLYGSAAPQAVRRLMAVALLTRVLPRLAAAGPRVALAPAHLETPEGPASARLEFAVRHAAGARQGAGIGPPPAGGWLADLSGAGELELPEPLARRWFGRDGALGVPRTTGGEGSGPSPLDVWLSAGWVTLREGRVASAFRLADGLLTLNGRTFPVSVPPVAPSH